MDANNRLLLVLTLLADGKDQNFAAWSKEPLLPAMTADYRFEMPTLVRRVFGFCIDHPCAFRKLDEFSIGDVVWHPYQENWADFGISYESLLEKKKINFTDCEFEPLQSSRFADLISVK